MDFDPNSLLLSFLIGGAGFVSFAYGKKQKRFPQMLAGFTLMVFPYFVSNLALMAAIAIVIVTLLWVALKVGL